MMDVQRGAVERKRVVNGALLSIGLSWAIAGAALAQTAPASGAATPPEPSAPAAAPLPPAPTATPRSTAAPAEQQPAQPGVRLSPGAYGFLLTAGLGAIGNDFGAAPLALANAIIRLDRVDVELGLHRHLRTDWAVGVRVAALTTRHQRVYGAARYARMWPGQDLDQDEERASFAYLTAGYEVTFGKIGVLCLEVGGMKLLGKSDTAIVALIQLGSWIGW